MNSSYFHNKLLRVILSGTLFFIVANMLYGSGSFISGDQADDSLAINKVDMFKSRVSSMVFDPETDLLYSELVKMLDNNQIADRTLLASASYFMAAYNQNKPDKDDPDAIKYFELARDIWIDLGVKDETYSKACSNLGSLYLSTDPLKSIIFGEEGLRIRQDLFGIMSEKNIKPIINLSSSYISASLFEETIDLAVQGIRILELNGSGISLDNVKLQYNTAIAYYRLGDYLTSQDYLKVAYSIYQENGLNDIDLLLRLLNIMAISYKEIGDTENSIRSFRSAVAIIDNNRYYQNRLFNIVYSNFAYKLALDGDIDGAEKLLRRAMEISRGEYGVKSIEYLTEYENFAYFLSYYREQYTEAHTIYSDINKIIDSESQYNNFLSTFEYGYARNLGKMGRYQEGIEKLNIVLIDTLHFDNRRRINAMLLKREFLVALYTELNDTVYLTEALNTIIEATEIYDKYRVELSNQQSQLKVAENLNNVYEDCLATLAMFFELTNDNKYKELLFIYSERSKVASLLSSTRTSKAIKFHIPENLAKLEQRLEKEINSVSELIYNERGSANPDTNLISRYEQLKLKARMRDDSLKAVFKRDYPRYNLLKSNTEAAAYTDVREALGKKGNFIEYYVSDTTLYIYLINRSEFEMVKLSYSEELQNSIRDLRNIIINPAIESGARKQYCDYTSLAYNLYKQLLEPIDEYLISDKLIIAPDHLLSYIPFEALLSESVPDSTMNYRNLPFLVNSFDITYAYSGTLLSETIGASRSIKNRALVFAPQYLGEIFVDSILVTRQQSGLKLEGIPGAREEAIFINNLLGGDLFIDSDATESRFKERAAEGEIIHLAMHTLLNDNAPMYSKMVFDLNDDGPNDGKLNTYEVYDIPLNAKMVVLSSCNTGSGYLQSGEGVMSLARGFFYSGSPTVVMSLWEVDDRSGSRIMNKFYSNLKRGYSKSKSLRMARLDYLKDADQMRSHPYFWCTSVIMGDDSAIFRSRIGLVALLLLVSLAITGIFLYQRTRSS